MGIGKRGSGPPRRPRNPVAKDVRTPLYRPRVEEDKRWRERVKQEEQLPIKSPDEADKTEDNADRR